MLSVLEAPVWWPFSGNPWKRFSSSTSKDVSATYQPHGKEGVIAIIPIVFSHHPDHSLKPGKLTILLSALEIADCHFRLLHRYERQDVDDIRAITGHEITIRQRFIGKPDITYRILSAKLPDVLPVLEMQYRKKMEFNEEAAMFSENWRSSPPSDRCSPGWQTDSWLLDTIVKSGPIAGGQAEAIIQDQEVSESEVQELRKILMKLKSIALDAECELERQDEVLDEMASSVDSTVFSIDKQTRRMRKLL